MIQKLLTCDYSANSVSQSSRYISRSKRRIEEKRYSVHSIPKVSVEHGVITKQTLLFIINVSCSSQPFFQSFNFNQANAQRPMVFESNPSEYCFTDGNTQKFQYCSTDTDCENTKKRGWFSDWVFPICMDLQPNTPYANGSNGICCTENAGEDMAGE